MPRSDDPAMFHNKSFTDVLRRLLVVIGCVVLATAQPMSSYASTATADAQRSPDTVIYPKSSTEKSADLPLVKPDSGVGAGAYFLVILVLAGAGFWLLWRKKNGEGVFGSKAGNGLAIEETKNLGNRQYLVVASYQGKKFLLGVTTEQIQMLTTLPGEDGKE